MKLKCIWCVLLSTVLVSIVLTVDSCGPWVDGTPEKGAPGKDGFTCSVQKVNSTQTIILCSDGTTATISDGKKGDTGSQPSLGPSTPMSLIEPCGHTSAAYKEELLCLYNGSVLASFSDSSSGQNTRFSIIPSGTYTDTDGSGCRFTVGLLPDDSSVVSWNAGSNSLSTWTDGLETCQSH